MIRINHKAKTTMEAVGMTKEEAKNYEDRGWEFLTYLKSDGGKLPSEIVEAILDIFETKEEIALMLSSIIKQNLAK